MKKLFDLVLGLLLALAGFSALATDHLEGILPLAKDDIAAVAKLKSSPNRHVMLYFGDHAN